MMPAFFRKLLHGQRGTTMIEVLVGLTILGLVGGGFMVALSTTSIASGVIQVQANAENLARNEMEYVKSLPYQVAPATYPALPAPAGYTLTAQASPVAGADNQVQKVVVTVSRAGESALVLEGLKMNR